METVASRDGTPIAFARSGKGPPLVLVHGSTADHTRWTTVLAPLEERFAVYAMDRRGRGGSGDRDEYALEREFDDVAAVVEAAGPAPNLLGHSFGGLCALEAAVRTDRVARMILYEPAFAVEGIAMYPPGTVAKLQDLLELGDRDRLLEAFFRDAVRMSDDEIARLRADPSWAGRLASAHTLVRELADAEYRLEPARFSQLAIPTLLLVGERSPPFLRAASEQVAAALPDARVVEMPGQGHVAMTSAPDLFVREVLGFLCQ